MRWRVLTVATQEPSGRRAAARRAVVAWLSCAAALSSRSSARPFCAPSDVVCLRFLSPPSRPCALRRSGAPHLGHAVRRPPKSPDWGARRPTHRQAVTVEWVGDQLRRRARALAVRSRKRLGGALVLRPPVAEVLVVGGRCSAWARREPHHCTNWQRLAAFDVEQWMGDSAYDLALSRPEWARHKKGKRCVVQRYLDAQVAAAPQTMRPSQTVALRPRRLRALERRRKKLIVADASDMGQLQVMPVRPNLGRKLPGSGRFRPNLGDCGWLQRDAAQIRAIARSTWAAVARDAVTSLATLIPRPCHNI